MTLSQTRDIASLASNAGYLALIQERIEDLHKLEISMMADNLSDEVALRYLARWREIRKTLVWLENRPKEESEKLQSVLQNQPERILFGAPQRVPVNALNVESSTT